MDDDLAALTREQLESEIQRLRAGIRAHRDSSGHDLCWHHPQLWGLLPEKVDPQIAVPPWPKFLRGCIAYRESLQKEKPDAPLHDGEFSRCEVTAMATCEVCGNDYDKSFQVVLDGKSHTFDSFECAIHALAPVCAHCECKIIGHGLEAGDNYFCCANCAKHFGAHGLKDRATHATT